MRLAYYAFLYIPHIIYIISNCFPLIGCFDKSSFHNCTSEVDNRALYFLFLTFGFIFNLFYFTRDIFNEAYVLLHLCKHLIRSTIIIHDYFTGGRGLPLLQVIINPLLISLSFIIYVFNNIFA